MDSEEAPAQRPVTLEITVEDVTTEAPGPDPPKLTISQTPLRENLLPQGESIDLGGEFSTPQEDSSATPSESLMDKLNDQMMESVLISDSPNNSEEDDDVAPMESFLDAVEEEDHFHETSVDKEEQSEIGQNTTEIEVTVEEQEKDSSVEKVDEETREQTDTEEQVISCVSLQVDEHSPSDPNSGEPSLLEAQEMKDFSVPVCTIFSHGTHPKSLVPDGFQPTLIKSPSFSMGSGVETSEAVTPSKLMAPLVCQPSPSLSKFFNDNGHVNPASDFFDSFTVPSSFISVSNPNADIPPGATPASIAPTPERQLSSTSSSISNPGGALDSGAPTPGSVFAPSESTAKAQPPPSQEAPAPAPAQAPAPAPQPQPFNTLQAVFSGSDDPFATALSLSEVDRRHDSWLPSEETRKVLISVATQQYSPAYVETTRLTMPGLKFDNLQVRLMP
ncbi:Trafficking protein particle complex subunit 12 [Dissostichus eleginoides]|uniref:Trafficking protein particle complex subunit 12 n=1 Tax=Dissostichus eleginoides TaxID=100907 RepID=A0AAD9C006_DISEL|nr:Trafficking protein particle complex subunit 12 [Dissostichus eleginoides]